MITWQPIQTALGISIITSIYSADGGEDIATSCAVSGEPMKASLDEGGKAISVYESWAVGRAKLAYRKLWLDAWAATIAETGTGRCIDAIISPIAPYTAPPHNGHTYIHVSLHPRVSGAIPACVTVLTCLQCR